LQETSGKPYLLNFFISHIHNSQLYKFNKIRGASQNSYNRQRFSSWFTLIKQCTKDALKISSANPLTHTKIKPTGIGLSDQGSGGKKKNEKSGA
jgi:hypothetical protein